MEPRKNSGAPQPISKSKFFFLLEFLRSQSFQSLDFELEIPKQNSLCQKFGFGLVLLEQKQPLVLGFGIF